MEIALWCLIVGGVLVLMGLSSSALKHLPLSTAMLYLPVGIAIGPVGFGLLSFEPFADARILEHLTEVVVVVSLFTVGLKLSVGLDDPRWRLPLRLAVVSMVVTVALVAAMGMALGLPLGAAVLLGAILAPTDPVLASDVQMSDPEDRDRLRVALTGEGGLNDGTAFPFVMLGLALLAAPFGTDLALYWLWHDVLWAVAGGIAVGAALGTAVGQLVLHLRRRHHQAVGYDDFLGLGLIALSYGLALLIGTYGFLAVFAAGVAVRRVERRETRASKDEAQARDTPPPNEMIEQSLTNPSPPVGPDHIATHPAHAPAFMAHAMLGSNEKLERIGELTAVMLIGAMLWTVDWSLVPWWFVPALFVVVRPMSVAIGLAGTRVVRPQRRLIAWFGVRGVGSLYYLGYAMTHGLAPDQANTLIALTLATVVASIVVHGISVTPLMARYERLRRRAPKAVD